jgi:hypothetical protein
MRKGLIILANHVYNRRARYSIIGTSIAWATILKPPHDKWAEFERDFRMYDRFAQ